MGRERRRHHHHHHHRHMYIHEKPNKNRRLHVYMAQNMSRMCSLIVTNDRPSYKIYSWHGLAPTTHICAAGSTWYITDLVNIHSARINTKRYKKTRASTTVAQQHLLKLFGRQTYKGSIRYDSRRSTLHKIAGTGGEERRGGGKKEKAHKTPPSRQKPTSWVSKSGSC